ncbi:hypothetical protein [Demequina sp. NBRC 110057]|uniref:hypothetical protein n=1 Tax=Demequina sp. NBRC 110057 TaxID=1570346 RepID=UPI000A04A84B|nr:hypothetical protein [Demequina sp. NBRC 110057]
MRALRTLFSAACILAGALLIVAWGVSTVAVRTVEDGTALSGAARAAFSVPSVVDAISSQVQDDAVGALEDRGVSLGGLGLEDDVRGIVDSAVRSPAFEDAVVVAADDAQAQFSAALTEADRASAPLVLSVDVSDVVNARVDDLPVAGTAVPDLSLPPVQIEAIGAETMDDVRTTYGWMECAAQWGLWAGIALLVTGILVSHRRRWFVGKALLAVGVLSLGFGLVVRFVEPDAILAFLPGGADGALGTLWADVLTDEAGPRIASRAIWLGAIALAAACVAILIGRAARRR